MRRDWAETRIWESQGETINDGKESKRGEEKGKKVMVEGELRKVKESVDLLMKVKGEEKFIMEQLNLILCPFLLKLKEENNEKEKIDGKGIETLEKEVRQK